MDLDVLAAKAVDEGVQLAGRAQIPIEDDDLDVKVDSVLFGEGKQLADRLAGAAVANVDVDRVAVRNPRNVGTGPVPCRREF
jgi:hypothetical protein